MSRHKKVAADEVEHAPEELGPVSLEIEPLAADAPATSSEELEALRRERDELQDQLLRRRADFENYRKRVERDRELVTLEAKAEVITGLLPTLDNLDRALSVGADPSSLKEGVELILRNLVSYLETYGVVARDPTGEPFNPQTDQALTHEPVPGVAEGTIVEVLRKAYLLKERLLRPALVRVAKGGNTDEPETKN